mgnify:CR=1 FL=1
MLRTPKGRCELTEHADLHSLGWGGGPTTTRPFSPNRSADSAPLWPRRAQRAVAAPYDTGSKFKLLQPHLLNLAVYAESFVEFDTV